MSGPKVSGRQSEVKALLDLFSCFLFWGEEVSFCKEAWNFSLLLPMFPDANRYVQVLSHLRLLLKTFNFFRREKRRSAQLIYS